MSHESHPVLLFDGVCHLCQGAVQWVLQRDNKGVIHYASLQSDYGKALLEKHGLSSSELSSTVLVDQKGAHLYSTAALRILKHLGGKWSFLGNLGIIFPRFLRDGVYRLIAKYRYRWFGKSETCWLPQKEWKDRFLDL